MKEFEICRQRTSLEEDAVAEVEWRRYGYAASVEERRQQERYDAGKVHAE